MEGKMRIKNVSSYGENKNHKYKVENLKYKLTILQNQQSKKRALKQMTERLE